MLTDLEITKLCAEAMGFAKIEHDGDQWWVYDNDGMEDSWGPLEDDRQAMELLKRFGLRLHVNHCVWTAIAGLTAEQTIFSEAHSSDLNRAICECVAAMQVRARQEANESALPK